MTLRHVEDRDALPFYRWWTHVETTRLFVTPKADLSWQDHLTWFVANFGSPWWLVGEVDGQPVGAVRIDPGESGDAGWISIVVAPEHRGKGYGQAMLHAIGTQYGGSILARVHELNAPSLRAFARAGYEEIGRDGVWRILRCG